MFDKFKSFLRDDDSGQALVEFALIFPLQLIFTFGLMQLMFLMISSLVVNYAAFRVARTAAVYGCDHAAGEELAFHNSDRQAANATPINGAPCLTAARIILSPLAWTNTTTKGRLDVPGWGGMRGTDAAVMTVAARRDNAGNRVRVDLTFYQELIFPFVDSLFMYFGGGRRVMAKGTLSGGGNRIACFPIRATTTMRAAPFDVMPGADCYEYGAGF